MLIVTQGPLDLYLNTYPSAPSTASQETVAVESAILDVVKLSGVKHGPNVVTDATVLHSEYAPPPQR